MRSSLRSRTVSAFPAQHDVLTHNTTNMCWVHYVAQLQLLKIYLHGAFCGIRHFINLERMIKAIATIPYIWLALDCSYKILSKLLLHLGFSTSFEKIRENGFFQAHLTPEENAAIFILLESVRDVFWASNLEPLPWKLQGSFQSLLSSAWDALVSHSCNSTLYPRRNFSLKSQSSSLFA